MTETVVAKLGRAAGWLHRRAQDITAAMLAVMFVAFIVQIVFRYVFNFPIGWSSELTIVMWLWGVLFGAAFVLREQDEIRFDILYGSAGPRARRAMAAVTAIALVGLYLVSLKPSFEYIAFMKVQKTAYLGIRFDWLYSIYLLFAVAIILRYVVIAWRVLRGRDIAVEQDRIASAL